MSDKKKIYKTKKTRKAIIGIHIKPTAETVKYGTKRSSSEGECIG